MIRIDRLSFAYRRKRLYDQFSLELPEAGVHGVFGRNGSGKSTLLKLLSGLLFPRGGCIEVLGHSPRARDPRLLEQVYLVPEEFHLPDLSADRLERTHAGFYPRFSREAFRAYLDTFELDPSQRFSEMSLGQKKKTVLAFALATFTPVLLLDEPTNGLDIIGRDQFRDVMARPEHAGRLVLISTHQAHDLERLMSHVLFLDSARLALSAPLSELAGALHSGVLPDAAAVAALPDVIYQEPSAGQHAFVARNAGDAPGAVHLELLYKALTRNKAGVDAALAARRGEVPRV